MYFCWDTTERRRPKKFSFLCQNLGAQTGILISQMAWILHWLVLLKAPFLVLHFSHYTSVTFLLILSIIQLSMLMILISTLSVIRHQWQQLELASELESDLSGTVDWTRNWHIDFIAGKTQFVSFDWSNNSCAVDLVNWWVCSWGKIIFSKLDWGYWIFSIAKTASKKFGALIHSLKFPSPEITTEIYHRALFGILLPCLGWCFKLLLGHVR